MKKAIGHFMMVLLFVAVFGLAFYELDWKTFLLFVGVCFLIFIFEMVINWLLED